MFKFKKNLRKVATIIACLAVTTMFASCDGKNGDDEDENGGNSSNSTFKLKIFQGYDFPNKRVVDYGSNPGLVVDIYFYYMGTIGPSDMRVYLQASKINYFENPPTNLTTAQVDGWNNWILSPVEGYYVVRSRDGRHYLLQLLNQDNYDSILPWLTNPADWVFTFDWKEITVK